MFVDIRPMRYASMLYNPVISHWDHDSIPCPRIVYVKCINYGSNMSARNIKMRNDRHNYPGGICDEIHISACFELHIINLKTPVS